MSEADVTEFLKLDREFPRKAYCAIHGVSPELKLPTLSKTLLNQTMTARRKVIGDRLTHYKEIMALIKKNGPNNLENGLYRLLPPNDTNDEDHEYKKVKHISGVEVA